MSRSARPDSLFPTLRERGVAVWDGVLGAQRSGDVAAEVEALHRGGHFRPAGVGPDATPRPDIRSDALCWLLPAQPGEDDTWGMRPGLLALREVLEALAIDLGTAAFVRLPTLEMMATHYAPGTFYTAHVDRFVGRTERHFTYVYFLNDAWRPEEGGQLVTHTAWPARIAPQRDRMVLFHAPEVRHEVAVTYRERRAVTGWWSSAPLDE